jgi:hypothetical protein
MRNALLSLRSAFRVIFDLMRELSDQAPYARHLAVHGVEHSAGEWRRFQNRRLQSKYARAKCC